MLASILNLIVVVFTVPGAFGPAQQSSADSYGCRVGYVIGPEDVLDVSVWDNTSVTRTVPVRLDGKISLPLLNDVQAAGLTPMQLREALTDALAPYITAPAVSVIVRETHSFKVSVIGQVKTPGRYEIKDRATVLDVLAMAGGLTEYAARSRVFVLRPGPPPSQIPFPYDRILSKSGSRNAKTTGEEHLCVGPGDVIVVP
jgi:polysaccharide export outer membrane protein